MKVLVTGSNGQLGRELCHQIRRDTDFDLYEADIDRFDITDAQSVKSLVCSVMPDIIINCAAYTNVDGCEVNPDTAYAVNADGPKNLAVCAQETGAVLIHVSTDYVFSGKDNGRIPHPEEDIPEPVSMYGKTKLAGERYVQENCEKYMIVRTAWLYGYYGKNFVKTIYNAAVKYGKLEVVNDQMGNPTNAEDLAGELIRLCSSDSYGIYHCTGEGICSWYDFASKIVEYGGVDAVVNPCTSQEYKAKHPKSADRPAWSALDNKHLRDTIGNNMREWQTALKCFFENWDGADGIKENV